MKHRRLRRMGFTLIELLVSVTVLALLIALVAQLVNGATALVSTTGKHMDADTQARIVLNRLAVDIGAIVKRGDVDYYFAKNTQNDQLAFYSEAAGYYPSDVSGITPKSSTCLAGYRVMNNHLERLSKALVWNGVSSATGKAMVFLPQTLTVTWPLISGAGGDVDYQVLGDQVYRFEFCFLMKDGTLSAQPWIAPNTTINGLQDVRAIVAAIAVLDNKSRVVAGDLTTATGKLGDVSGTTIATTPGQLWWQSIQNGDLGLIKGAASQVRIYERYFSINSVN